MIWMSIFFATIVSLLVIYARKRRAKVQVPRSVNYHFTRKCNYRCGFCFHTAKTSFVLPLADAKRGLKMLKEAGIQVL